MKNTELNFLLIKSQNILVQIWSSWKQIIQIQDWLKNIEMSTRQKHKIKKFLNLLKNAQNEAFVKLVVSNLQQELCTKPEKLLKVTQFLTHNVLTCEDQQFKMREFARVRVAENLTRLIVYQDNKFEQICSYVINGLNTQNDKWAKKVDESYTTLLIPFDLAKNDPPDMFQQINIYDILKSKDGGKLSTIADLMATYDELLRDSHDKMAHIGKKPINSKKGEKQEYEDSESDNEVMTTEQLKAEIDKGQKGYKLSDFIEEEFIKDCLAPVGKNKIKKKQQKVPLSKFIESLPQKSLINLGTKKMRQEDGDQLEQFILLSPVLAVILHFSSKLTDEQWEVRQVAACGLNALLPILQAQGKTHLKYATICVDRKTDNKRVKNIEFADLSNILTNVLVRSIIVMLKDQFCDFEDINPATPVRTQTMQVIQHLFANQALQHDKDLLVQNLPQLLFACESDWQTKLSFFKILKAICVSKNENKNRIFEVFGRDMLIESMLSLEDTVKIAATDLMSLFLDDYFRWDAEKDPNKYHYIDNILKNLSQALRLTDDIEGSVIYIFNLIYQLLTQPSFKIQHSAYKFQSEVFFPFNFHRVLQVRKTFQKLVALFIKLEGFEIDQLYELHTLIVQALIMEEDKGLQSILRSNLEGVIESICKQESQEQYVQKYLNEYLFMPHRFQKWLYSYEITKDMFAESFLFVESPCFESLEKNYYVIAYEPITSVEKREFYFSKLAACVDIIEIVGRVGNLQTYVSQLLKMNGEKDKISQKHVIEYLVYWKMGRNERKIEKEIFQQLRPYNGLLQQIQPSICSTSNFLEMQALKNHLEILAKKNERLGDAQAHGEVMTILNLVRQPVCNVDQYQARLQHIKNHCLSKYQKMPQPLAIALSNVEDYSAKFVEAQESLSDRFKALVVDSHLLEHNIHRQISLHAKMNDIIRPVWNLVKSEKTEYYQHVFASILSHDLLNALYIQNKRPQINAILKSYIIKTLAKLSWTMPLLDQSNFYQFKSLESNMGQPPFISDNDKVDPIEVKGCQIVLAEILTSDLSVYNSTELRDYVMSDLVSQEYVNIVLQIIKTKKELDSDVSEKLIKKMSELILQNDFSLVPDLFVRLFYKYKGDQQIDLALTLSKGLENQSQHAFVSLLILLDQALNSKDQGNESLQDVIKYVTMFLLPVIKNLRYSNQIFDPQQFDNADSQCMRVLSLLIQLLPLSLSQDNTRIKEKLGAEIRDGLDFMEVFSQSKIDAKSFKLEVYPKTELRDYQKEGIQWMAKLGRYGLNCSLCDDMGLGKTIQSLTVMINESRIKYKQTGIRPLNLVICPNTLTYQWHKEVSKFFDGEAVSEVLSGHSWSNIQNIDILVTSYEKARNDIDNLAQLNYFYVVLDEGHRIKNSKSKTTQTIKSLNAERKLVLTGTPLQNKVSELWSIFDFLMPSFLEEEKVFNHNYNQFLTSNLNKLSEKLEETQNFINALKSLKKRIAPFILRRTKQDVLKDLPPKTIQDFECQMTPSQQMAHNLIDQKYPFTQVNATQADKKNKKQGSQVLQNLIFHRKVCNHPKLVSELLKEAKINMPKEDVVSGSGKLVGLIDLLKQCEIIDDVDQEMADENKTKNKKGKKQAKEQEQYDDLLQVDEKEDDGIEKDMTNYTAQKANEPHRALIFCQMQSYQQMIQEHVLEAHQVKYTIMHSSLNPQQRFDAVEQFNNDSSIRVMIMTTAVGGLGLNLTGADTVIFMEHDWNPMKDLQAIDRAHRIGQTRKVNVYRLILMDTLEQNIMSLQRFKKNLANNLIQSSRADISIQEAESMQMHDLLSTFEEHTVYANTTQQQIIPKAQVGVIGAESYQDRLVEEITGGQEIWDQQLEDL